MKKLLLFACLFALALSACGGIKANVSKNAYAKESQVLVERWLAAYRDWDASALLGLYSDDIVYSFCGTTDCERYQLAELKGAVTDSFKDHAGVKVAFSSYYLTQLGERAVVQGRYTDPDWQAVNAETTVILEIKNGKITRETWYWAGS